MSFLLTTIEDYHQEEEIKEFQFLASQPTIDDILEQDTRKFNYFTRTYFKQIDEKNMGVHMDNYGIYS